MTGPFYGKYRGVVTDTDDPLTIGRIKARVPDVMSDRESGWAMPCMPFVGKGMGFYAVPATGAGVWIEFEQGDPDRPIWSGCWWGSKAEMPNAVLTSPTPTKKVVLQTDAGNIVVIDDSPGVGGITLKTASGQKIVLSATGIEIDNGKGATIKLEGPKVSINGSALEVT